MIKGPGTKKQAELKDEGGDGVWVQEADVLACDIIGEKQRLVALLSCRALHAGVKEFCSFPAELFKRSTSTFLLTPGWTPLFTPLSPPHLLPLLSTARGFCTFSFGTQVMCLVYILNCLKLQP